MVFLVMVLIAVVVVVLVMRAGAAQGGVGRQQRPPRARGARAPRPLGPDDDPQFLRELERRTRRDDGSPA